MSEALTITLHNEIAVLDPLRALYLPAYGTVVVSDLHLGKAAHLRKHGSALPEGHDARTLDRLSAVLATYRPEQLIVVGDLFHSVHNRQWERLVAWRTHHTVPFILVRGNHDLLADDHYADAGIRCVDTELVLGPFRLRHHPSASAGGHVIAGHIHPGVVLRGEGLQRMQLPCFHIGATTTVLPAFGTNTGLHRIRPLPGERVYAVTDTRVFALPTPT